MSVRRRRTRTETEEGEGWTTTTSTSIMTPKRRSGRREEGVGKGDDDGGSAADEPKAKKRGVGWARRPLDAVVAILAVVWVGVLCAGEVYAHGSAQRACSWPEVKDGTRVMVVADPQLVDEFTYKNLKKGSIGLAFAEAVCDAYVKRALRTAVRKFSPDKVVFLGDLFGHGARLDEEEWHAQRRRVDAALRWPRDGEDSKYLTVVGNHDVGYAEVMRYHPGMLARFEEWYGRSNFVARVGGVDFVGVNAMVLDGHGPASNETWAFIDGLGEEKSQVPRVLLTHVPLPNPGQKCGPNRNSGVIPGRMIGKPPQVMYQDYLTEESAQRLLRAIEPALVLSGHDHDQCEVTHEYESKRTGERVSVRELTVGTVSALNGNDHPSFLMMTVPGDARANNGGTKDELIPTKLCLLPDIRRIVRSYARIGICSVLIILGPPLGALITAAKAFASRRTIMGLMR